ncbi:MAG: hypothetical protein JO353_09610, partial [Phycisphaerae bacterium]|nr:hypothetical protein [Phycisphaerae bacterium]
MSDAPQQPQREPSRPLSEISHLFLSNIRDRQTNGTPRPVRKGPPKASEQSIDQPIKPKATIDLTPEEFAQVYGTPVEKTDCKPNVTAVIAAHLNGRQVDRAREYAAHMAEQHGRVGLIEVDAWEFRVMLFERGIN